MQIKVKWRVEEKSWQTELTRVVARATFMVGEALWYGWPSFNVRGVVARALNGGASFRKHPAMTWQIQEFVFGFMYVLSDVCWDIECPEYAGAIVVVLISCQL